jgi:hypothetical protein
MPEIAKGYHPSSDGSAGAPPGPVDGVEEPDPDAVAAVDAGVLPCGRMSDRRLIARSRCDGNFSTR